MENGVPIENPAGRGTAPSGAVVILHFSTRMVIFPSVFAHLHLQLPVRPIDNSLK